ncbi:MAG: hypothetical protein AB7O59_08990 [Pirellulales bacterium]
MHIIDANARVAKALRFVWTFSPSAKAIETASRYHVNQLRENNYKKSPSRAPT